MPALRGNAIPALEPWALAQVPRLQQDMDGLIMSTGNHPVNDREGYKQLTACMSCGDINGHAPNCSLATLFAGFKSAAPAPSTLAQKIASAQTAWENMTPQQRAGCQLQGDGKKGPEANPDDLFYLQDSRNYVGNDMLFHRTGGRGYTSDLREAEVLTREKAQRAHDARETDIPWPKAYIDARTRPAVDMQYVKRAEALKDSGITINKPRKSKHKATRDTINCSKCGAFARLYHCCKRCGTDNRP